MMATLLPIPDRVRRRALALGDAGVAWLAGLGNRVRELAREWDLTIEQALPGGTESFVARARTRHGEGVVLKIALPGLDPTGSEWRTLAEARGRGYAKLLRHDAAHGAMLLECLGCQLHELGLPVDAQIEAICATLVEAWMPLRDGARFMTGAEKGQSLADFIVSAWRELGEPCAAPTIETACRFADARRRAFDPADAVLAHGDPHAWNTLVARGEGHYKFVDPDGLFIERAYDLGILMREWSAELLADGPLAAGLGRCARLARLTGIAPEPIWQWGFVERTATGLLLHKLGLDAPAREALAIADAWATADVRW